MLEIKCISDLTFKYIHDLIEEFEPSEINFIEDEGDTIDINNIFIIANLLQTYKPDLQLTYITYRKTLPMEELDPDVFFRGIPFNNLIVNNNDRCKSI